MSYLLHPEAETELGDAAVYYAENASAKIAISFLSEFERVIELLQLNPQIGKPKEAGMRSYHFQKFPYSILYRENDYSGPQVYAVAHQNREPGYWQTRL